MGRRAAGLILAALCVAGAGAALADLAGSWRYIDFWCFYHGGEAVVRGADPYDPPAWSALTADPSRVGGPRLVKDPCPGAFAYPYWTGLAFAPLALLPYDVAAGTWGAVLIAAIIAGVALVIRATGAPWRLVVLIAAGSLSLSRVLTLGQVTGVLLPLVSLSAMAPARRAGVSAALLVLKPQLAGLFTLAAMFRAGWRAIWSGLAAFALLAGISVVARPTWPAEWWAELTTNRAELARPLPTAIGLATTVFGDARIAIVLIVAAVLGVAFIARGRAVSPVAFVSMALGLSLFAVPYAYSYDHLALLLPWAFVAAVAAGAGPRRRRVLLAALVGVAIVLPWAIFVLSFGSGSDTWNAVTPVLSALLVAAACPRGATMGS